MTKPTRSEVKEARCMHEDVEELNELYADVKLIAKKLEAIVEKIGAMSTAKHIEYLAYIKDFDMEETND
jgi:DNA polymerase III delta prime subunit